MISIVDDDESVCSALTGLIRSLGYIAHGFHSAEDFLRSAHVNDTSCLIADVQMPGMSGIELQQALVANGHKIPVIFISAFSEERRKALLVSSKAICFLRKPFDSKVLIDCLETALRKLDDAP
jgi:FixJ family two-component response regulator